MTAYFDDLAKQLHDAYGATEAELEALERALVRDVTLAAESDGFPTDLRDAIHRAICRHGVWTRPDNDRYNPRIDAGTGAVRAELRSLTESLHGTFHEVARRAHDDGSGRNDNPRSAMDRVLARGEEYREMLAQAAVREAESDSVPCDHPRTIPAFDAEAALGLDPFIVRRRWPRFHGPCPDCGVTVCGYASVAHFEAGSW